MIFSNPLAPLQPFREVGGLSRSRVLLPFSVLFDEERHSRSISISVRLVYNESGQFSSLYILPRFALTPLSFFEGKWPGKTSPGKESTEHHPKRRSVVTQDIQSFSVDKLTVKIHPDRRAMGKAAGQAVASKMRQALKTREKLSMVFAAAPSQNEFLQELSGILGIDWNRVVAFHLDEYLGLPGTSPQSFGNFLRSRLFEKVRPGKVHYLNGMTDDPESECERYARLLHRHPLYIACIGIGENGHIAFNDPPVAEFKDPLRVKIVDLGLTSRKQQVNDGCFQELARVPKRAMTLTIPAIFAARFIYCIVPAPSKAEAVRKTLKGVISTKSPASILRKHEHAILFLDPDSASRLLS